MCFVFSVCSLIVWEGVSAGFQTGSFITPALPETLPIGLILPITFSFRDGLNTSNIGAVKAFTNAPAIPGCVLSDVKVLALVLAL